MEDWLHNLKRLTEYNGENSQSKLIEEVRKISAKQRCVLWFTMSGAQDLKKEAERTYDELVNVFENNENVLEEYVLIQIRKDINRSGLSDSAKIDTLERILCAYAFEIAKLICAGNEFLRS